MKERILHDHAKKPKARGAPVPMNDQSLKLPIWQTAISGYGDGVGALFRDGKLFRYFIYASALTLILIGGHLYVTLGDAWLSESKTPAAQMTDVLFSLLVSVAYAIAVSPVDGRAAPETPARRDAK
jgi:hypothetical protein